MAPPVALVAQGPRIQITVMLLQTMAAQLLQQGQTLPSPISGYALIDTGASSTCIDEDVAKQLKLPVIDVVQMASASQHASQQNVYPAQFEIVGIAGATFSAPRTIGTALAPQGIIALIGRDLLSHGVLIYNGFTGQMTFTL